MRCLNLMPLIALMLASGGLPAQDREPVATGWQEYTLGPAVELTPRSEINRRGNIIRNTDVRLTETIATTTGLWAVLSPSNEFVHWQDGAWHTLIGPAPLPDRSSLSRAIEGPDGAACFMWSRGARQGMGCAMFREGAWRLLAEPAEFLSGAEKGPTQILADTRGRVWCDQAGYLDNQPGWTHIAQCPEDSPVAEFLSPWGLSRGFQSFEGFYRLDPLGRVWRFSANQVGSDPSLPVVIIEPNPDRPEKPALQNSEWGQAFAVTDINGNWLTPKPEINPNAGAANRWKAQAFPRRDGFFWVILYGKQLWEVNPATLEGKKVWEGKEKGDPYLESAYQFGSTSYVLGSASLYRISDGRLSPVTASQGWLYVPKIAVTADGAWFPGRPDNLWFLPNDGDAFRAVDRQSGVMMDNIYGVAMLPSGDAVAWSHDGAVAILPKAVGISTERPLLTPPDEGSIGQIPRDPATGRPGCGWIQSSLPAVFGSKGNLYAFPTCAKEKRLARWDGKAWNYVLLPDRFKTALCDRDMAGNIWAIEKQCPDGKQACAKFLPDEERWQEFDDIEEVIPNLRQYEMVFQNYMPVHEQPVRNRKGDVLRITAKDLRLFHDGKWTRWSIPEFWDILSRLAAEIEAASPPLPPNMKRQPKPSMPDHFDEHTVITRIMGDKLALRLFSGGEVELHEDQWAPAQMYGVTGIIDPLGVPQADVMDKDTGPGQRWRNRLECAFEMKDGCLYRVFNGESKAVFAEMPVTPLPLSDTTLTGRIGPGNWPVLSTADNLVFVLLDPILPRPNLTVQTVRGNCVRIAAAGIPQGAQVYWREGWPDTKTKHITRNHNGEIIREDKEDPWKQLPTDGVELGPFGDGDRIYEVVAADAQSHTSETLRAVLKIEPSADNVTQWARAVADAWPNPAPDAEASLLKKGRAGLAELHAVLETVPPDKAPALRRMAQRMDADERVPAPDPPVPFPELPADIMPKIEPTGTVPIQAPEGWVWRIGPKINSWYDVQVWTGQRWFARKADWNNGRWPLLNIDSAHRIWLTDESAEEPACVFSLLGDSMTGPGTWKKYASLRDALGECATPTLRFSRSLTGGGPLVSPLSSATVAPSGDLAFVSADALHARIGGKWLRWGAVELPGAIEPSTADWRLSFDDKNRLGVERKRSALILENAASWTLLPSVNKAPQGTDMAAPLSTVRWEIRDGDLYGSCFGVNALTVPKSELPEKCPSEAAGALLDPTGTMFLTGIRDAQTCVHFHCSATPPKTNATVAIAENGARVIRVEKPDPSLRHAWRLDGGDWQDAVADAEIRLPKMTAGKHVVDVCAVNATALPDPAPPRLEFEVGPEEGKAPMPADIDGLLRRLTDASAGEREQAASALAGLGTEILPQLKALLDETKDDNARWWIEAVIERIETDAKERPGSGSGAEEGDGPHPPFALVTPSII